MNCIHGFRSLNAFYRQYTPSKISGSVIAIGEMAATANDDVMAMSLDDIISTQKKQRRGGGRTGASRADGKTSARQAKPYQKTVSSAPLFTKGGPAGGSTKIIVSSLAQHVTKTDVKDLFTNIGNVKAVDLNCNESGKSKGSATVMFVRAADAQRAVKEYNNRTLDGKKMKIELIVDATAVEVLVAAAKPQQARNEQRGSGGDRGAARGRGRGGSRGVRQPRVKDAAKSAVELDAELDTMMTDEK